jgi:TetR/AcrR family fatty acid metabolism transcriptional regulator
MADTLLDTTVGKQDRILEAAVRVFAENGYHGSSMAAVAQEAGVAAGTIYLYFGRKQDLLITLFRRDLGDYIERCRPALEEAPGGVPRLRLLVEHHLAFFEEDRARASVFQLHAREPDPILSEGIRPVVAEYFDIIGDVLSQGVRAGAFAADLDVRLARHVFFGALDDVVTGWLKASHPYPLLGSLEPLAVMLARAFGAPVTGDPS